MKIIALNSTPLIYLARAGGLRLLTNFRAVIDSYVYEEVVLKGLRKGLRDAELIKDQVDAGKIELVDINKSLKALSELLKIGYGEASAMMLVREGHADFAIIDDKYARNVAKSYGIEVHGTLFLILMGIKRGIMGKKEAIDLLARMIREGFRISPEVVVEFSRRMSGG